MLFEKDPKTRYVDMAIYIDDHIYSGNFDEELVYQYLYFLIYMLAKKKRYFSSEKVYDDFSIWFATKMYVRLTDPRQFDDNEKLGKITSVLNYIKGILYAKQVEYNNEIGFQKTMGKFQSKYIKDFDDNALIDHYRGAVESRNNDIIKTTTLDLLKTVPALFKKELSKSPYKNNKVTMHNLYLSCLLTFIKTTTFPNHQIEKVHKSLLKHPNADISKLNSITEVEIVLWDIPDYLSDYIKLIYNRVKNTIVDEIKDGVSRYSLSMADLTAVINSNYEDVTAKESNSD